MIFATFLDLLQNVSEKFPLRDAKQGSVFPGPNQRLTSENMKGIWSDFPPVGDDVLQDRNALDQVVMRVLTLAVFVGFSPQQISS